MTKKIISIAPSFNCSLSCEGCYLTTDVTEDMKSLVKGEKYFLRAIEKAKSMGYTEFAITWNPYPGAFPMTEQYVRKAKSMGMETSVTTVLQCLTQVDTDFLDRIDTITISVDDMRFKDMYDFKVKRHAVMDRLGTQFPRSLQTVSMNYNILWTPGVFKWLYDDADTFKDALDDIKYPDTIQHLIYKPLSLYESETWFWENYKRVYENYAWLDISGTENPARSIGDIALNNMMGLNNCPGEEFQMIDIDPMGFVRRCPENPTAYDCTTIAKLGQHLKEGTPCKKEKCNCITGLDSNRPDPTQTKERSGDWTWKMI